MNISKASNYAICSLVYLANEANREPIDVGEIAERLNISHGYLAKIFQLLSRARLVFSQRGPRGGYTLAHSPEEITLLDVVEAVEGVFRSDCHEEIHGDCRYVPFCKIPEMLTALSEEKKRLYEKVRLSDMLESPGWKQGPGETT